VPILKACGIDPQAQARCRVVRSEGVADGVGGVGKLNAAVLSATAFADQGLHDADRAAAAEESGHYYHRITMGG